MAINTTANIAAIDRMFDKMLSMTESRLECALIWAGTPTAEGHRKEFSDFMRKLEQLACGVEPEFMKGGRTDGNKYDS